MGQRDESREEGKRIEGEGSREGLEGAGVCEVREEVEGEATVNI